MTLLITIFLAFACFCLGFYYGRLNERRQRRSNPPSREPILTPMYSRLVEHLQLLFANDPRAQLTLSVDEKSGHIAVLPSTNHDNK